MPFIYSIFLFTAGAAIAGPTLGDLGLKKFEPYDVARASLLRQNWKLDPNSFPDEPDYKAFPEVVCGRGWDAVCSVQFQKEKKKIMLYLKSRSGRLVVDEVF